MKRNGRPPLDKADPSDRVTVWMPAKQLDDLCRQAHQKQVSVGEIIRQKIWQADSKRGGKVDSCTSYLHAGRHMLNRAYAILHIKSADDDERLLTGIATTPEPDRHGDIIEPLGVSFKNPLPLLLFHNTEQPVGFATFKKPTKDGIAFTASISEVKEPGTLKNRLDEAWQAVKAGLISGVSIGFRATEMAFMKETGGMHFLKTEVMELSLVTIPANADASILSIKQLDKAASGHAVIKRTGPVSSTKKAMTMPQTTTEQISAFEATRAAKDAARTALMTKAATDNQTLDQQEAADYDSLTQEIEAVDQHLVRLHQLEKSNLAAATAITVKTATDATAVRSGVPIITVKSQLPKGTAFIRACQAMIVGRGNKMEAAEYAKRWTDSTPEVELYFKAAVAAGTTTDATWAGPLAAMQPLATEFLEFLRPATILGKVPGFFKVPFNVSVPSQTGGGTYQWVGQGAPKPVGKLQFGTITLGITKCAGIIVITEELARNSTPSAEAVIRRDMVNGIAQFLDVEFTDPTKAAVAGVSPGSVTNAVTPITTTGTSSANARQDIVALMNAMTLAGVPVSGTVLLLSEANALSLSAAVNAMGQPLFPGLGINGGQFMGISIITSQVVGNNVILLQPECIMYADDGGVTIDISREASVQMDSAPMNPPDATVVMTSLWQSNLVGLRADRYINWKKARAGCVQYTVATYTT